MVQLSTPYPLGWPLTGEWAPREALFVKLLWPLVCFILLFVVGCDRTFEAKRWGMWHETIITLNDRCWEEGQRGWGCLPYSAVCDSESWITVWVIDAESSDDVKDDKCMRNWIVTTGETDIVYWLHVFRSSLLVEFHLVSFRSVTPTV